ncbi:hypothetical protein JCM19233_768 [Vibrio astriarenae]|nr:hypothetical protein JCM19233_768 [Vibrio sp. C7]
MSVSTALVTSTFTVLLVTLSFVAVTVVIPTSTPDSNPLGETVAMLLSGDTQVTELLISDEVPSL